MVATKKVLLVIGLLLLAITVKAEEPKNYCYNQEMWDQWHDLVAKNLDNDDIQILHALRIGLCFKVEQGSIELERGVDLFDRFHKIVIERNRSKDKKDGEG